VSRSTSIYPLGLAPSGEASLPLSRSLRANARIISGRGLYRADSAIIPGRWCS
jgi:hypothetical protein